MLRKRAEAEKAKQVAAEEASRRRGPKHKKATKQQLKILRARVMIL
jgi:hypothetical protein